MRAALYLRLSESDDASTSIARQEADLRLRAEREGWEIHPDHILVDDGISGRKSRANAEAALRLLATGEVDVLAVWKFDRWSRQGLGALARLIEILDARPGALFVADRDGLSSAQPAWRIIASVLAEVARMEAENTQARVRSSIAALRKARRFPGGTVPYGYRPAPNPDGPGRVLEVDPDEAEVIREAASRVLAGTAAWKICQDFNERGIPAPRSAYRRAQREGRPLADADRGTWRVQSLRRLLTGPHLLGRVTHHGDVLRDDYGLPLEVWEPILDVPTSARLQAALLPDPTTPPRERQTRLRALSGLVRCASCGRTMYVRASSGRPVYGCPGAQNGETCPSPRVSAEALEAFVIERVRDALGDYRLSETVVHSDDPGALIDVEEALQAATDALREDDADLPALLSRIEALKARRSEIRASSIPTVLHVLRDGPLWTDAWNEAEDDDRRRSLLQIALDGVYIAPTDSRSRHLDAGRVRIDWKPDLG